jgi:phosphatidylglycerol:prolipoprotein diacylglycerol transferase
VEFVREPDPQVGLFFGLVTMGQLLSSTMIAGGLALWFWLRYRRPARRLLL